MEYNDLVLFGFGAGGILIHSLLKIDDLKRKGKFSAPTYLSMEWPSISISLIILLLCLMGKHEVSQLEQAGKWLGLAFTTIGYMGQSIFVKIMGRTSKKLDALTTETNETKK